MPAFSVKKNTTDPVWISLLAMGSESMIFNIKIMHSLKCFITHFNDICCE